MIPLDKTIITQEMIDAAVSALVNEDLLFGESVTKFEEEFARFCGVDFAISVGSGTEALIFSLIAIGVEGKQVLTTPTSYVATANCAFHAGGTPVFCDIKNTNNNIDPVEISKKIKSENQKKIGAIIPVHLHGHPADMKEITEIAETKRIPVIEDACQAHGATYFGRRIGSIGDVGCFSFNPVKNMTVCGEGGMVTTNDERMAKKVRMLADSGRESPYSHEHKIIGYSSRINTINAAIGRIQLKYLDDWNEKRIEAAKEYYKLLDSIKGIELPGGIGKNIKAVYNKFAIKTNKRNELKEHLYSNGIECDSHYPIPIHLQPAYTEVGYKKGNFPNAERFAETTLSLPMFIDIKIEDITYISKSVREFCGEH